MRFRNKLRRTGVGAANPKFAQTCGSSNANFGFGNGVTIIGLLVAIDGLFRTPL
jgi:hypothetical protein